MTLYKAKSLALLILFLFLASCSTPSETLEKDLSFIDLYPKVSLNQNLKLRPLKVSKSPNIEDEAFLVIENKSAGSYQFPADYNVAIWEYQQKDKNWKRIVYRTEYLPDEPIILSNDPDFMAVVPISLQGLETDARVVRVAVYGNLIDNGSLANEMEGAFIDITLEP